MLNKFLKLLLLSIISILLKACSDKNSDEIYSWKEIEVNEGNCGEESCINIAIKYPIIQIQEQHSDLLNEEIQRMINQHLIIDGKSIPSSIQDGVKYFKNYFKEEKARFEDRKIQYTAFSESEVSYQDSAVHSIIFKTEIYTGGANGMSYFNILNFQPQTGSIIRFEDLIINRELLEIIAEQQFRKQFKIADDVRFKDVGYFLDEDFFITEKIGFEGNNLVILYDKYEAGAGYIGPIQLKIPLSELEDVLNLKFK
ncbi:MAG TPA: DUF3298 and DUF4163 domain-containing protein [Chitinophagaceae bacterium]|nr:DUF3298 and DUF4163 domain-containing protein [Chitinophagaceae bacterium]